MSEEEVENKAKAVIAQISVGGDSRQAMRDMMAAIASPDNAPHFHKIVEAALVEAMEKKDTQRQSLREFLEEGVATTNITTEQLIKGWNAFVPVLDDVAVDIPMAPFYAGEFIASALLAAQLTLSNIVAPLEPLLDANNDSIDKVALSAMKIVFKTRGIDFVKDCLKDVKFVEKFISEKNRSKLDEIAKKHELPDDLAAVLFPK